MSLPWPAPPFPPRKIAHYVPEPPAGGKRASFSDVTVDDRGLIYLLDRQRGVDNIETNAL